MSCERYRDTLTDLAAGGPVPAGLDEHLASCASCREELTALRRALAIADGEMARLAAAEPSPALAARIRQAAAAGDAAPAWRLGWLWPAAAVAATLAVGLAVWAARARSPQPIVADTPVVLKDAPRPGLEGSADEPEGSANSGNASSSGPTAEAPDGGAGASLGTRGGGVPREDTPDALVPPGEAEALLRLAALVHRGEHAPAGFLAAGQPSTDLVEAADLQITPLEIVPLDPAETPGT